MTTEHAEGRQKVWPIRNNSHQQIHDAGLDHSPAGETKPPLQPTQIPEGLVLVQGNAVVVRTC